MAGIRSIVTRAEVDVALRAHNCQRYARHRIQRGHKRLKVRNGRGWDHYCLECARAIVLRGSEKLHELAEELNT